MDNRPFPLQKSALIFGLIVLAASVTCILNYFGMGAFTTPTVHEAEGRSMISVALFPGHALRELPHVLLIGLLWLEGLFGPLPFRIAGRALVRVLIATAICATLLMVWAAAEAGWASAWTDLSQARAAIGLEGPGSHFRFHLLSDVALAALFFSGGRLLRSKRDGNGGMWWFAATSAALMLLMLAAWGAADVTTPRYIGHQAREVFTHTIVTLPLLIGLTPSTRWSWRRILKPAVLAGAGLATVITLWLAWSVAQVDILSHGANPDIPAWVNLSVHNLEHLIDLAILVVLTRCAALGVHRT